MAPYVRKPIDEEKDTYIKEHGNDSDKEAWFFIREFQAEGYVCDNLLDVVMERVWGYAAVRFQPQPQMAALPAAVKRGIPPPPPSGSAAAIPPAIPPPAQAQPPPRQRSPYTKPHQTASIILQAASAIPSVYPADLIAVIDPVAAAAAAAAVNNGGVAVLKSVEELVMEIKGLGTNSTGKRRLNKWARESGFVA